MVKEVEEFSAEARANSLFTLVFFESSMLKLLIPVR